MGEMIATTSLWDQPLRLARMSKAACNTVFAPERYSRSPILY